MAKSTYNRGMTLIEVLIALVIITIGLLAISDVIAAANIATIKGDYFNVAAKAAGNQIAAAESAGYAGLTTGTTDCTGSGITGLPSGAACSETISQMGGNANIKEVDVTITWTGGNGATRLGGHVAASTAISAP